MVKCVAVIGLGSIGLRHAQNLSRLGMQVLGYDPDPQRCEMLLKQGGATSSSADAALRESDAVVIATPNAFHFQGVADAIDAGCHVFVEKPLAHSISGLEELLSRAEGKGLTVFVGMNLRYHPVVKLARNILADGTLGKLLWGRFVAASYLPNWRPQQDYRMGYAANVTTGGVVFDFIHEFDLAWYLLGAAKVLTAHAESSSEIELDSDSIADVVLRHDTGIITTLHVDYVTKARQRRIEVAGTQGVLFVDIERSQLLMHNNDGEIVKEQSFETDVNDMYFNEMDSFLKCARDGGCAEQNSREALEVLALVLDIRKQCGLPS